MMNSNVQERSGHHCVCIVLIWSKAIYHVSVTSVTPVWQCGVKGLLSTATTVALALSNKSSKPALCDICWTSLELRPVFVLV